MSTNNELLYNFYTTPRLSKFMADDGGPFGFDIHFALEVDYLIKNYNVDVVIETGTNAGDTADFISKNYPLMDVITSEINTFLHSKAHARLSGRKNIKVLLESSENTVKLGKDYTCPLFFLDAHWGKYWPLSDELKNIEKGIIIVSDFDIGKKNVPGDIFYGFDTYNNVKCNKNLVLSSITPTTPLYVNNAFDLSVYPYPCLQMKRRAGRCYFTKGINIDLFCESKYFYRLSE